MSTTQFHKTLEPLSSEQQLTAMAVGVVFERIFSLSEADRNDLFELLQGLSEAGGPEDVDSIRLTMLEILSKAPVGFRKMPLPADDDPLDPESEKLAKHIGKTVRRLREKALLSQTQLADKAGITQSHVSRIENGSHTPNHLTVKKIAEALGIEARKIDPCLD